MNPCGQVFVRTYAFLSLGQILTSGMPRCVLCLVTAQAPPGSSDHGDSPGKNTGVGCHALFQGIFPTQGSNPGILHCRWILYQLSHKGSPRILEWVACPFSSRSFWPRKQTRVFCTVGGFFTNWQWELDHKECRLSKNWCLWTVVLEKTPETPLDSKEIKPVNLKRNQP